MAAMHKHRMRSLLVVNDPINVGWGFYHGHGYPNSGPRFTLSLSEYKIFLNRADTERLVRDLQERLADPDLQDEEKRYP